jgi:hypothetical protein
MDVGAVKEGLMVGVFLRESSRPDALNVLRRMHGLQ